MSTLYKLVDTIIFNPDDSNDIDRLRESNISPDIIKQIEGYLKEKDWQDNEDCIFFIFSLDENIKLHNKPKPEVSNSFIAYYKIKDLLEKKLV